MNSKPVLLVFIDWFSPGYKAGGPISSGINFVYLMKDDYQVYVFTSDTDHGETVPYEDIITDTWVRSAGGDFMIYYARKATLCFRQIRQVIKEVNPDFVYLNNMFSPYYVLYPVWLKRRRLLKATTILTPRGTLYDSALAVKPFKKKVFINVFRWLGLYKPLLFQATSGREAAAIARFFPGSRIKIAEDLPTMQQPALQTCTKNTGSVKCIFIARLVPIKNLLFLLQVLEEVRTTVDLTVVGPVEDTDYWTQCQQKMVGLPAHIKVLYAGAQPAAALPALIQQHHLYVLPTLGENFGHTIFEALLMGRPVLISDQTPWLQLQQNGAGWDLPLADPHQYAAAIEAVAAWTQQQFDSNAAAAWAFANNYLLTAGFKAQYQSLFS